jgi:hypothetical protein
MSFDTLDLHLSLKVAAAIQAAVALVNLALVRLLNWKDELERQPLLLRQVFMVHLWFISFTVGAFAVLTWRFADEMASGANVVAAWVAGAIGLFWGVRTVLQVIYYSASHWRGRPGRTALHIAVLLTYGGMAVVYLLAAARSL